MEVETIIQVNKIEFSLPKTKLTEEKKTTGSIRVPKAKSTGEEKHWKYSRKSCTLCTHSAVQQWQCRVEWRIWGHTTITKAHKTAELIIPATLNGGNRPALFKYQDWDLQIGWKQHRISIIEDMKWGIWIQCWLSWNISMEILAPQPCFSRWHVSSHIPRNFCFSPIQHSGLEEPRTPPMPYKNPSAQETSGTFDTIRGLHPSVPTAFTSRTPQLSSSKSDYKRPCRPA